MNFLLDIICLLVAIWFLPYLLVGVLIGKVVTELNEIFYISVLWTALSVLGLAVLAWFNRISDDTQQFVGIVDAMAQSSIVGVQMPYLLGILAVVLFGVSATKAFRKET